MNEKFDQEIVALPSQESQEAALIQLATNRIEKMVRLKELSLKVTNSSDWVDFSGKPYLNAGGSEKVGRLFGVKIRRTAYKKERGTDELGDYYFYVYTGVASLPGEIDEIEVVGTCSSRDKFFAYSNGAYRPLSEVDETNIMKSAYTNMVQNGVTRLLGMRNLTWEELKHVGSIEKVARVEYKDRKQADSGEPKKESTGATDDREKNRKAIIEMLLEMNGGDETAAKDELKALTAWGKFTGVNHSKEMLTWDAKRIYAVMNKVKGLYKEKFGKDYEPEKTENKDQNQDQGKAKRLKYVEMIMTDINSYAFENKINLETMFEKYKKAYPDIKGEKWEDMPDEHIEFFLKFIKS
jgi:hypothetical protein